MEGMGEEKLYFLLLKLIKRKKSPLLGKVSQLILSPILDLRHRALVAVSYNVGSVGQNFATVISPCLHLTSHEFASM